MSDVVGYEIQVKGTNGWSTAEQFSSKERADAQAAFDRMRMDSGSGGVRLIEETVDDLGIFKTRTLGFRAPQSRSTDELWRAQAGPNRPRRSAPSGRLTRHSLFLGPHNRVRMETHKNPKRNRDGTAADHLNSSRRPAPGSRSQTCWDFCSRRAKIRPTR